MYFLWMPTYSRYFRQNLGISLGWWSTILLNIMKIWQFFGNTCYTSGAVGRPRETHFATISIFRRIQVFFRGNYFFQSLAPPVGLCGESPPWEGHIINHGRGDRHVRQNSPAIFDDPPYWFGVEFGDPSPLFEGVWILFFPGECLSKFIFSWRGASDQSFWWTLSYLM